MYSTFYIVSFSINVWRWLWLAYTIRNNFCFDIPCIELFEVHSTTITLLYCFFFCLKDSTWAPYEQTKKVSRTFSFSRRYLRKKCVRVVNNNMYICTTTLTHGKLFFFGKGKKLTKSNNKCNLIFSKIACPHSRWLHGHHVGAVVDSADRCCNT